MLLIPSATLATLFCLSLALPVANNDAVSVLWTFPNETWIENLAVRQNRAVLCTSINRAAIYQVDPFEHTATTVHQFSSSVLGLAEISVDVFAVVTAEVNLATNAATPGSAAIWRVDMSAWSLGQPNVVTLVVELPRVGLPDGATALQYDPGVVLVADASKGLIWRVDTTSGAYSIAIDDPLFKPIEPSPLGVDGIHIVNDELYFTNLGINLVGKLAITAEGSAAGPVQNISTLAVAPDDFALAGDGTVYAGGYNTLWRIQSKGTTKAIVGDVKSTAVQGITSAQFGRTAIDRDVVYMGTNGGMLFTPPGAEIHGGQLLAVNVGLFA